jgi:hypothetical protein
LGDAGINVQSTKKNQEISRKVKLPKTSTRAFGSFNTLVDYLAKQSAKMTFRG